MSAPPPSTPRRSPRQRRSQERVDRVLDAARDLLTEGGYETLSMRDVADRAGVATGSLYQFFAGKQEVVRALARRYVEEFAAVVDGLADEPHGSWGEALDAVFDAYVAFHRSEPGFRVLWVEQNLDATLPETDRQLNAVIADAVRRVVEPHLPRVPAEPAFLFAMLVDLGDVLLDLAFAHAPEGDPRTVQVARRTLHLHVRDALGELPA